MVEVDVTGSPFNKGSLFSNRRAVLISMHDKEKVIAPLLAKHFQIQIIPIKSINTDSLGTFSGEIERPDTPLNTLRMKTNLANHLTLPDDLVLASEGSFNPHPEIPFLTMNTELVMLIDKKHQVELTGKHISFINNLGREVIGNYEEAQQFASRFQFPTHGIIMSPSLPKNKKNYYKGITNLKQLKNAFHFSLSDSLDGKVIIETDMRACFNPTRMKMIEEATRNLISLMTSYCPVCSSPGYQVTEEFPGLPCSECGEPTKLISSRKYSCLKCSHSEIKNVSGDQEADPMYCDLCNP